MQIITQLYPLLFVIIHLSGTAESEDNTLINDDLGGVLYKAEDDLEIKNYKINNVYYNTCTYNNGKDPNIRKNIEEILKVLVKDSLPLAMETLDEQEHDIARDIQVAANKIIIQLALHASNITRKILQSMEKPNDSQVVTDTEMHNELIVYQKQIEKMEELEDKISLLSNKTKELIDTINVNNNQQSEAILKNLIDTINVNNNQQSESLASLNNKIAILKNLTDTINVNNNQQSETILKNLIDTINVNNNQQSESLASLNNKIAILKNLTDTINVNNNLQSNSIAIIYNKIATLENLTSTDSREHREMLGTIEIIQNSVMNLSETCQKIEKNTRKEVTFCNLKVPASIKPNPNIWKDGQIPEKDDLDTYMINKTGCSYRAVGNGEDHVLAAGAFPGQLEWRVAVRAREYADMKLYWDLGAKYAFYVGYEKNTVSVSYDSVHEQYPERRTPGLLAEDRYVPLYIRINNGKLTAGAECESKPWFTADFTREKGQQIERRVSTWSSYGAKFLYDCPASFTGQ